MNQTVNKLHPSTFNYFSNILKSNTLPYMFCTFNGPDTKNFTNSPIHSFIQLFKSVYVRRLTGLV